MATTSQPASATGEIQAQALDPLAASAFSFVIDSSGAGQTLTARTLDAGLACLVLILLAPLLVLMALLIRLDSPGPVLFRQTRTGLHGRVFRIYKFRTMHVQEDGPEIRQACRADPRVTRVGRILRCTHLDELPQLLNVLRGEMTLVGPRPHALAHDEHYSREIPLYSRRFQAKPGMTGWAQVNGARGETPTLEHMQRRIELDLWYVENRSLTLDLQILARTAIMIFIHRSSVC
jgi:exopolysaccharide biosynthesis polyprenyl glycosylphosphotransferase